MNDDTLRDTLLTDIFVSSTLCQVLHQTIDIIPGDSLYSQYVRVKFHFWQTQCIL